MTTILSFFFFFFKSYCIKQGKTNVLLSCEFISGLGIDIILSFNSIPLRVAVPENAGGLLRLSGSLFSGNQLRPGQSTSPTLLQPGAAGCLWALLTATWVGVRDWEELTAWLGKEEAAGKTRLVGRHQSCEPTSWLLAEQSEGSWRE